MDGLFEVLIGLREAAMRREALDVLAGPGGLLHALLHGTQEDIDRLTPKPEPEIDISLTVPSF